MLNLINQPVLAEISISVQIRENKDMWKLMFMIAAAFLAGCTTTENYEKALNSWMGASESSLISQWGPPDSVYEHDGTKYLTYVYSDSSVIPGSPPTYQTQIIGNRAYTTSYGGSSDTIINSHCKTIFTITNSQSRNAVISNWRYEGNACRA